MIKIIENFLSDVLGSTMGDMFTSVNGSVASMLILILVIFLLIILVGHLIFALMLWKIAKNINVKNKWLSWIPIINFYIVLKCADLPGWLMLSLLLFILPVSQIFGSFVSLAITFLWVMSFWRIAEKVGYPNWTSLLLLIPIVNIIILVMYAFFPRKIVKKVKK